MRKKRIGYSWIIIFISCLVFMTCVVSSLKVSAGEETAVESVDEAYEGSSKTDEKNTILNSESEKQDIDDSEENSFDKQISPSLTTTEMTNRNNYSDYDHSYDAILKEAMLTGVTDVTDDKYGLTKDKYVRMLQYVQFTNPEIIGVHDFVRYFTPPPEDRTVAYKIVYTDTFTADRVAFEARLPEVLAEVMSLIPENATDLQKVLIAHDYLVMSTKFNQANIDQDIYIRSDYDAFGVFVKHEAVCQGYSNAFKYLMDNLGIECALAESNGANHAWNLVKLNGEWYHIDCSADDTQYDMLGHVSHQYFLLSTETLLSNANNRSDFVVLADDYTLQFTDDTCALDKQYESNQPWSDVRSACYYYKDSYYTIGSMGLYKDGELLYYPGESMIWHPYNISSAYYYDGGVYGKLVGIDNAIYFSSPKHIYRIDLDTQAVKVVYTPELEYNQSIYGFGMIEGQFYCGIESNTPNQNEPETWTPITIMHEKGDLTLNYRLELDDVIMAKALAMKLPSLEITEEQEALGDLDDDGKITINEVRRLRRIVLNGSITE